MSCHIILHGICAGYQHAGGDEVFNLTRFEFFHNLATDGLSPSGDMRPGNIFVAEIYNPSPLNPDSRCMGFYHLVYLKGIKEISRGNDSSGRPGSIGLTIATDTYVTDIAAMRSHMISLMQTVIMPSLLSPEGQWTIQLAGGEGKSFVKKLTPLIDGDNIFRLLTSGKEKLPVVSGKAQGEMLLNPADVTRERIRELLGGNSRILISDSYPSELQMNEVAAQKKLADDARKELSEKEKENTALKSERTAALSRINTLETANRELEKRLEDSAKRSDTQELRDLKAQINARDTDIAILKKRIKNQDKGIVNPPDKRSVPLQRDKKRFLLLAVTALCSLLMICLMLFVTCSVHKIRRDMEGVEQKKNSAKQKMSDIPENPQTYLQSSMSQSEEVDMNDVLSASESVGKTQEKTRNGADPGKLGKKGNKKTQTNPAQATQSSGDGNPNKETEKPEEKAEQKAKEFLNDIKNSTNPSNGNETDN